MSEEVVLQVLSSLCLSFEHGILPGNLHYTEANPNCASLHDGTFKVRW